MSLKNEYRGNRKAFEELSTSGEVVGNEISLELGTERSGRNSGLSSEMFFENPIARETKTSLESVRWLTTSEAAQYLRVSMSGIKTMVYRGQVRAHKLGRRNRFLLDDLDRLITLPRLNRR